MAGLARTVGEVECEGTRREGGQATAPLSETAIHEGEGGVQKDRPIVVGGREGNGQVKSRQGIEIGRAHV